MSVRADTDPWWFAAVHEAFESLLPAAASAQAKVYLSRAEDTISVSADVEVALRPQCGRCLESFEKPFSLHVRQYLVPAKKLHEKQQGKEVKLDEEDLEFGTYKGHVIRLGEILREQMVLAIPIRFFCREDCRGLCPHCGTNLNQASCSCHEGHAPSPFEGLKSLKI